jgi:hypothetical protein
MAVVFGGTVFNAGLKQPAIGGGDSLGRLRAARPRPKRHLRTGRSSIGSIPPRLRLSAAVSAKCGLYRLFTGVYPLFFFCLQRSPVQCLRILRNKKIRRQANPSHFTKFGEIQENTTEMHLMSETNRIFLKTRKPGELADNSVE